MERRTFFGAIAGLVCLPLLKPRRPRQHKYFEVPDGYVTGMFIPEWGSPLDHETLNLSLLQRPCRWQVIYEGDRSFFRVWKGRYVFKEV